MKTRIISGLVMAAIGIPVLLLSEYWIFPIVVSIMAAIAVWELLGITGFRKNIFVCVPAYAIAVALPPFCYNIHTMEEAFDLLVNVAAAAILFMLYLIGFTVVKRGAVKLNDISLFYVYYVYIVFAFTAVTLLRYIPNGVYNYMMIFIAAWICDISAYFVGFAIGKHKLIPEVSPKKTWEGAIGGVFFTTVAFLIYGLVLTFIDGAPTPNFLALALLGAVLSTISQFGDLSASLLKREKGVKDFGKIFPGHGGVLDRFDSLLPVAPVLLMMCLVITPFA